MKLRIKDIATRVELLYLIIGIALGYPVSILASFVFDDKSLSWEMLWIAGSIASSLIASYFLLKAAIIQQYRSKYILAEIERILSANKEITLNKYNKTKEQIEKEYVTTRESIVKDSLSSGLIYISISVICAIIYKI